MTQSIFRSLTPLLVLVAALPLLGSGATPSGSSGDSQILEPGVPIERPLADETVETWRVYLEARRHWCVRVSEQGIDAQVAIDAPDGRRLAAVGGPEDHWGTDPVVLGVAVSGVYRIEVRSLRRGVAAGRFRLEVEELGVASREQRLRIEAEEEMTRAGSLLLAGGGELQREAAALYGDAAEGFAALGLRRAEAVARLEQGVTLLEAEDSHGALSALELALPLWRELGEKAPTAFTLAAVGLAHVSLNEAAKARPIFEQGLAAARESGDRYDEASLRNDLCLLAHIDGKLEEAAACYREVVARFRDLDAEADEGIVLNNLGGVYYLMGEPEPALANLERALVLRRRSGTPLDEVDPLNTLASLHRSVGEIDKALSEYERVLEIVRAAGDQRREAIALNNIGFVYREMGELERARAFFEEALPLRRSVGNRSGEAATLNNLGEVRRRLGDPEQALRLHEEALALQREIDNRRGEGLTLSQLGSDQRALDDPATAVETLERASTVLRDVGDRRGEAGALEEAGKAFLTLGRLGRAAHALGRSLELYRAASDPVGEVEALTGLARLARRRGRLQEAAARIDEALSGIESLRGGLVLPSLRASFLATQREAYELHIDLLMERHAADPGAGFDRAALEASEMAHARSLLDLLREAGWEQREGVDPKLSERWRALERRLSAKAALHLRLESRGGGGQKEVLERQIATLSAELEGVEAQMRRSAPRYAALTRPQVLDADAIQRLVGSDTLLLEYALGEDRSFLWAVGAEGVRSFTLPGRPALEELARQVFGDLKRAGGEAGGEARGRRERLGRLLLGPVVPLLGDRRVAVVADGGLAYLPFGALPIPRVGGGWEPLLLEHEVVELPSASALAALRRLHGTRHQGARGVFVLADPVFSRQDPRVDADVAMAPHSPRSAAPTFARLRFSRVEADAIAGVDPGDVDVATGFAARRSAIVGDALSHYRIVHFATHGVLDSRNPGLSSLVLSQVDQRGAPIAGFLRLNDIYNLRLNADLVVLSGCRTALGREIRGEGLVGLASGFLYAGAPRVVASLWQVEDRATATLMKDLYRSMLDRGLTPAAALRQARLAVRSEEKWSDPYYWASFILEGDWR